MVVIGRIVMGVGMGMARALCPSYIEDVVHPRNGWLETCLPPAMTAAGILLGQVWVNFILQSGFSSRSSVATSRGCGFVLHSPCWIFPSCCFSSSLRARATSSGQSMLTTVNF